MLVTFWVHGRGRDEPEPLGWIKGVWHGVEENLRWVGGYMGVSEPYEPGQPSLPEAAVSTTTEQASSGSSGGGWFSGLAGSLRGSMPSRSGGGESRRGLPPPGTYKIGEVKAEYVKVCISSLITRNETCWLMTRTPRANTPYYHSLSTSQTQEQHIPGRQ